MRVVWLVSFPKYQTIKFVLSIFKKWDIYCKSKRMYNAHKFAHTVTVVLSVNFVSIGCWHWTCNILNNPQYIAKGSIKLLGYCFIGCFIIQNHVYIALCKLFILFHSSFWWLNSESHYLNVPVAKWGGKKLLMCQRDISRPSDWWSFLIMTSYTSIVEEKHNLAASIKNLRDVHSYI